jgi:hypothetical protein
MSRKRIFTICLLLFAVALSVHLNGTSVFGQAKPPAGDASTAGQAEPDNAEPSPQHLLVVILPGPAPESW